MTITPSPASISLHLLLAAFGQGRRAKPYSITSSARASSEVDTARPSVQAVFRLMAQPAMPPLPLQPEPEDRAASWSPPSRLSLSNHITPDREIGEANAFGPED
jgi:hypothetical protein